MQSIKSPQRKSNEYHFCIKVTPKALSIAIFESKGIQSLYKLQVNKGSKKETSETMKRNLHQQALEGFYRSQSCYFTLTNYTNFRPYEMTITFSETNSFNQQQLIFNYKFSTFGLVKNFLQNGVQRSTHVVTKDFQTEFYIDFYIQSHKGKLQDTVKYDSKKQILKRKNLEKMEDDEKDSDVYKKSVTSNNSPSKSSRRASSTVNHRLEKGLNTRSSTPLFHTANGWKRKEFLEDNFNDARSEKISNRSMKSQSQTLNVGQNDKKFLKKYPSTRLSYGDYVREDQQNIVRKKHIFNKFDPKIQILSPKLSEKKTIKYERMVKEKEKNENGNQFGLRVFLNMRDISLDEVSYQINKNILIIILVSIIFFIVVSKTVDSITLGDHRLAHKKTNSNRYYDEDTNQRRRKTYKKVNYQKDDEQEKTQAKNTKRSHKKRKITGKLKLI